MDSRAVLGREDLKDDDKRASQVAKVRARCHLRKGAQPACTLKPSKEQLPGKGREPTAGEGGENRQVGIRKRKQKRRRGREDEINN